jgi:plastocyanin
LVRVEIAIAAPSHTFTFDSPETQFKLLDLTGAKAVGVGFFPKAGDYAFHCTTPGHLEGGMKGVVHVTGPTVTLAEALKDAGNPPTAAAG